MASRSPGLEELPGRGQVAPGLGAGEPAGALLGDRRRIGEGLQAVAGVERFTEAEGEVGFGDADVATGLGEEIVQSCELDLGAQEVGAHEHSLGGVGAGELDMRGDGLARLLEERLGFPRLGQTDPGLGRGDRGLIAGPAGALGRRFGGEAGLLEASGELASGPDRDLDLEPGDRGRERIGIVRIAGDEVGEGEALLIEQQSEGVGGRVGADPLLGEPHLRQAIAGRLLGARFGGALAGGGGDGLARLQPAAIERRGEGQRFLCPEGRSERRARAECGQGREG